MIIHIKRYLELKDIYYVIDLLNKFQFNLWIYTLIFYQFMKFNH